MFAHAGSTAGPICESLSIRIGPEAGGCMSTSRVRVGRVLLAIVVGLAGAALVPVAAVADTPLGVPGLAGGRVAAGIAHSCALLDGGNVICWGNGSSGQLGYNSTVQGPGYVPLPVGRTAVSIDGGAEGVCAVLDDGSVSCWGYGLFGALGHDSMDDIGDGVGLSIQAAGPVLLPIGRHATAVSIGGYQHTCALLDDGTLSCWGSGNAGKLGHNSNVNVSDGDVGSQTIRQAGVVPLPAGRTATAVSAGYFHTCAILDDGTVRCWGSGTDGALGYGSEQNIADGQPGSPTIATAGPVPLPAGRRAIDISAGYGHSCAVLDDGSAWCWGRGGSGQLGHGVFQNIADGQPGDPSLPAAGPVPLPPGRTAIAIAAGTQHTCAILDDSSVRCWGDGTFGKLGYGSTDGVGGGIGQSIIQAGPVPLPAGRRAVSITVGDSHSCAVLDDGALWCWGRNSNRQLGHIGPANVADGVGPSIQAVGAVPVGASISNAPGSPGSVSAVPGDGRVTVSFTPPASTGTSAVQSYTVTASPGGAQASGASSPIVVTGLANGTTYTFTVTARNLNQTGAPSASATATPAAGLDKVGYYMLRADGFVYGFGDAQTVGSPSDIEAVDLEPTPTGNGYWIVDRQGTVHAFGDAQSFGNADLSGAAAGETIASLSATPSGQGYWLFSTRGRVFTFGNAQGFGDLSALTLNGPILGSISTPSGLGYYMVASDGGVFTFGDATFLGSMGGIPLNQPVQGLVPTLDGKGYWLVASDGGIFAFGAAPFRNSIPGVLASGQSLNQPIVGMVRYGDGYLMVASDGGIFSFSDRPFLGSLGDNPPSLPIINVAALG
jgi:alpha-tubulin suppressor-like RCC1 family protein